MARLKCNGCGEMMTPAGGTVDGKRNDYACWGCKERASVIDGKIIPHCCGGLMMATLDIRTHDKGFKCMQCGRRCRVGALDEYVIKKEEKQEYGFVASVSMEEMNDALMRMVCEGMTEQQMRMNRKIARAEEGEYIEVDDKALPEHGKEIEVDDKALPEHGKE